MDANRLPPALGGGSSLGGLGNVLGVARTDIDRFNNLRPGHGVRFYGYRTSNTQVALRQFY